MTTSTQQLANARKVGRLNGRNVFRFDVLVRLNNSRLCRTVAEERHSVIAHSAADAANLIRDRWAHRPETEIITFGPKGGETFRFVGWESAVSDLLWRNAARHQLTLEV